MKLNINQGSLAWLCFAWAALILLGITVGWNAPFVLALIGTALMLVSFS